MKKIIIPICLLAVTVINAQSFVDEAVGVTNETMQGSARYRAMGGSMGALGSDISAAMEINPAGSALSVRSNLEISLNLQNSNNNAADVLSDDDQSRFSLNQIAGTLVVNNAGSDWNRIIIGGGYSRVNDFKRRANLGELPENIQFTKSYLYDSDGDGTAEDYLGDFIYDGEQTEFSGYREKIIVNVATSYKDKIFIGGGLNFHGFRREVNSTNYTTNISETDNFGTRVVNDFYNSSLATGTGFSLSVGVIAKLNDMVRVGAAYESPTWWYVDNDTAAAETIYDINDLNNLNQRYFYDPAYQQYDLQTPGKLTGSIGLVIAKRLALNTDFIFKDYGNIDYSGMYYAEDENNINNDINNSLQSVFEFRAGAEYKVEDFKFRAGFRTSDNPYNFINKNNYTYAGGIGYSFGNINIDASYDYTKGQNAYFPLNANLVDKTTNSRYTIVNDFDYSNFMLTVGFKF